MCLLTFKTPKETEGGTPVTEPAATGNVEVWEQRAADW